MSMFIVVSVVISFLSLVIFLSVKRFRANSVIDEKGIYAPYLLLLSSIVCILDICSGGNVTLRISADLCITLLPFMALSSSLWKQGTGLKVMMGMVAVELLYLLYLALALVGILPVVTDMMAVYIIFVYGIMAMLSYLISLWAEDI